MQGEDSPSSSSSESLFPILESMYTTGDRTAVKDDVLWKKYDSLPPLPGFATNVVLFFRERFVSATKKTAGNERARFAGLVFTDIHESEEAKLTKEVCRHLMYNGVESVQLVSNYQEYVEAVTAEVKQKKDVFKSVKVQKMDMSTEALLKRTDHNPYTDVTVALLLPCRGRHQQTKLWEIVTNAYKASRLGVVIIGSSSILTDPVCSEQWGEFVDHVGDGWKNHLEIVCRKHHLINRTIVTAKDLTTNAPYGGCSSACGEMKCGHYCPHVCHAIDPDHQSDELKCLLPCQRVCDVGHRCTQVCSKDCGVCYVVIPVQTACVHAPGKEKQVFCYQKHLNVCRVKIAKKLSCGHSVQVECCTDISEYKCTKILGCLLECGHIFSFECWKNIRQISCKVPVVKQFDCGHEIVLECEEYTVTGELLKCNELCGGTLPCGHLCQKPCHITEDPNHENFQCEERCKRMCPRRIHTCPDYDTHLCCEPCPPCTKIFEYPLICGHAMMVPCNEVDPDPDAYFCRARCMRKFPFCLHPCNKLCGEDCGRCETLVSKANTGCTRGHFSMVPCQVPRERQCKVRVLPKETPECGHDIYVECFEADIITKAELAELCKAPCKVKFDGEGECGHECQGCCSDCFQGRLHMRCMEPCGRILICGHSCTNPCGMVCPPCRYVCFNSCEHGQCEYECGVPCVRDCEHPCPYECDHLKCTRKCHQVCDRKGCNEPCPLLLDCGHSCVGFCGELCPPLCAVCTPEKLLEGSFCGNTEVDPEDKFIYLPDCGHCIESNDFENWINIGSDEILPIRCPVCNARLKWIRRYSEVFNANHQLVQSVREKIFGNKKEIKKLLKNIGNNLDAHLEETKGNPHFSEYVEYISSEINRPIFAQPDLTVMGLHSISLDMAKFLKWTTNEWINASRILREYFQKLKWAHFKKFSTYWEEYLVDMLAERVWPLHPNEIKAMEVERVRMEDIVALYARMDTKADPRTLKLITSLDGMRLFQLAEQTVRQNKLYNQEIRETFQRQLKDLDAILCCTIKITEHERLEIVGAFGHGSGRWFKCARGHVYVVTECGGATEMGKCNECGADIGGINHVLVQENYLATEMDDAEQPLYPTALQRNMDHFNF